MRNTNIDDVIFPVKIAPVYVDVGQNGKQSFRQSISHKAIVDRRNGKTISIVSKNYKLITNQEAIGFGRQCIEQLLTSVDSKNVEIFNIVTPDTHSYCYVDLIHKGYEVNIWGNEVYIPFVRISNSYNRSRSLSFLIGFCRKICENGMIFEKDAIEFKFSHTRGALSKGIDFSIGKGKMKQLEKQFQDYMAGIRNIEIPPEYMTPVFFKALNMNFDIESKDDITKQDEQNKVDEIMNIITPKISSYVEEHGNNAYALFNVVTDYASNQEENNKRMQLKIPTLQRRSGEWIKEFVVVANKEEFTWDKYLDGFIKYAKN